MARSQLSPQFVTSGEFTSAAQWQGPLFVIGMWRSGTSLLYALLNQHPQIALMYEGDLPLLRPLWRMPGGGSRWVVRWEFWNEALTRHKLEATRIPLNVSCFQTAMEAAYQLYARQQGAVIWGDKSPNYCDSLTWLARVFPNARFIIIWRDPAAIIRSIVSASHKSSWFGRRGMALRALMGYKVLKTECERLASHGSRVHEMQYETLTRDPAGTMADACRFLGVPFMPGVGSLRGADRSAIYQAQHHALVRGERIVWSLDRPEVLSVELRSKIERYVSLWREESGGQWPILSYPEDRKFGKPSPWERFVDRVLYRCLRMFDSIVVVIYCSAPLSFLKRFRAYKRRHDRKVPTAEHSQYLRSTASDNNRAV